MPAITDNDQITPALRDALSFDAFTSRTGLLTVSVWLQIVWGSTKSVGCGYNQCGGNAIYSCRFFPAGNILGQFQQQVKG